MHQCHGSSHAFRRKIGEHSEEILSYARWDTPGNYLALEDGSLCPCLPSEIPPTTGKIVSRKGLTEVKREEISQSRFLVCSIVKIKSFRNS